MHLRLLYPLTVIAFLIGGSQITYGTLFNMGGAEDYAVLFQGAGGNTLQVTNVTINGHVGVAGSGQMTDSGPSTIHGRVDFSAADSGQFHNNNGSNIITGGVHYNVSATQSAMDYMNNASLQYFNSNGTDISITSNVGGSHNQAVNASAGALFSINGQSVHVFDATSFSNQGGNTLTINGSASDLVVINLGGLGNIQIHGGIQLTGGITADNVLFNIGGGNYANHTGAASLDINNNGGVAGIAQGIFLDPNGAISVTNAMVLGRVFGGDSHDFQFVSGANITAPSSAPETGTTFALLAIAMAGIEGMRRRFSRKDR